MVFEVYPCSISTLRDSSISNRTGITSCVNYVVLSSYLEDKILGGSTCLQIPRAVILGLMIFIGTFVAMHLQYPRKCSAPIATSVKVPQSQAQGHSDGFTPSQMTGNRNSSTLLSLVLVDGLTNLLQTLFARRFLLSATSPAMVVKRLMLIYMMSLPTLAEGHCNNGTVSVTNADVVDWVKTAPQAVKKNFRITLSNEIVFQHGLLGNFLGPQPEPPGLFHIPIPRCITVDCCPGCPGHPDPGDLVRWVRTVPIGIRENFQISITFKDILNDGPDGGTGSSLNEVTIRRLWVTAG